MQVCHRVCNICDYSKASPDRRAKFHIPRNILEGMAPANMYHLCVSILPSGPKTDGSALRKSATYNRQSLIREKNNLYQCTLLSEEMASFPSVEYNLNNGLTPYGSLAISILLFETSIKQNANTPSKD